MPSTTWKPGAKPLLRRQARGPRSARRHGCSPAKLPRMPTCTGSGERRSPRRDRHPQNRARKPLPPRPRRRASAKRADRADSARLNGAMRNLAVECGSNWGCFTTPGSTSDVQTLGNGGLVMSGVISGALDVGICDDIALGNAALRGIPIAGFAGGALFTIDAPTLVLVSLKSGAVRTAKISTGKPSGSLCCSRKARSPRRSGCHARSRRFAREDVRDAVRADAARAQPRTHRSSVSGRALPQRGPRPVLHVRHAVRGHCKDVLHQHVLRDPELDANIATRLAG